MTPSYGVMQLYLLIHLMLESCSQVGVWALSDAVSSQYTDLLCLHCLHGIVVFLHRAESLRRTGYTVYFLPFVWVLFSYHHYYSNYFYYFQYPPSRQAVGPSATAEIWLSLQWLQFTGIFQRFHDRSSYQQPIIGPHIQSTSLACPGSGAKELHSFIINSEFK